jgi:hypothetical protein
VNEFTTQDFIDQHKLPVSVHDRHAARLIGAHLRGLGYRRVRKWRDGRQVSLWIKSEKTALEMLKDMLRTIK